MGTTLTGTTPQDTYDSLIKVTDNGPLSGSLKKLTDGLGNDSSLSLSTTAASFSGTLAVSDRIGQGVTLAASTDPSIQSRYGLFHGFDEANITSNAVFNAGSWKYIEDGFAAIYSSNSYNGTHNFSTAATGLTGNAITFSERLTITNAGNVGIGTSSPTSLLNLSSATPILTLNQTTGNSEQGIEFDSSDVNYAYIRANAATGLLSYAAGLTGGAGYFHRFIVDGSERLRITPNGITFNGDTAAANALDDYEEGTFTPTTAGDPTGAFSATTGEYTKIGNVVHFRIVLSISSNFTDNFVAGLPYTVGGSTAVSGVGGAFNVANDFGADIMATTSVGQSYIRFYSNNDLNNQAQPTTTWATLRIFGSYRV